MACPITHGGLPYYIGRPQIAAIMEEESLDASGQTYLCVVADEHYFLFQDENG